jgi:hypothetical protein
MTFTWYSSVTETDKEEVPLALVTTAISDTQLTSHLISSSTMSAVRFSGWCFYFVLRKSWVEILVWRRAIRGYDFSCFSSVCLGKCQNNTVNITKASLFHIHY